MKYTKPVVNIGLTCCNGFIYSKLTLNRIFKTVRMPFTLTVVDNASQDKTRQYLLDLKNNSEYCLDLNIILNDKNLGAGFAHNQEWNMSQFHNTKYTCFCDNDLYFWDGWLESLLAKMKRDSNIGAITPLRISQNTPHYIGSSSKDRFESTPNAITPRKELEYFFNTKDINKGMDRFVRYNGGGIKKFKQLPASMPAHCMLVKTKILNEIGFAADSVYKYYGSDDIDLCWEILRKGRSIALDKDVYVHHYRHKSVQDTGLNREKILKDNNLVFANKWRLEIENIMLDKNYQQKITDLNNEEYSILRHMTLTPSIFQEKDSQIFAAWGCLGKTTFCKKFPNIAVDVESSYYQYLYNQKVQNIEKHKGLPNRKNNPAYPANYVNQIKSLLGKYPIIFIAIAPEVLLELEKEGLHYSIIYPKPTRKKIILNDAKLRGNNVTYRNKLRRILSNDKELKRIQLTRKYDNIYYLPNTQYIEHFLKNIVRGQSSEYRKI